MKIIPTRMLESIQTGNPYKGKQGYVDLGPSLSTMDVAELFPFHPVDNGSLSNIRSHLLANQIRVGYHENNIISEIEILAPDTRIPEMAIHELLLGNVNVFGKTLSKLKSALEADGFELNLTREGFDIEGGSVSFYSHDYEKDLEVKLDTVVLRFP
jgi:hypothetical protein